VIGGGAGRRRAAHHRFGDAAATPFTPARLAAGTGRPAFQIASTSGASLAGWSEDRLTRTRPCCCSRPRARAARPRAARRVRAARRRDLHRRGLSDGDVVGDVLAGSTLQIVTVDGRGPRRGAGAGGRPPSVFGAFAANPASLGWSRFRTPPNRMESACQTLARFTTAIRADRVSGGRWPWLVLASDLNIRGMISRCTRRSCRSCTSRALPGERRAHAVDYLIATRRRVRRNARIVYAERRGARRGPRTIAVNVDRAKPIRRGCRRTSFSPRSRG